MVLLFEKCLEKKKSLNRCNLKSSTDFKFCIKFILQSFLTIHLLYILFLPLIYILIFIIYILIFIIYTDQTGHSILIFIPFSHSFFILPFLSMFSCFLLIFSSFCSPREFEVSSRLSVAGSLSYNPWSWSGDQRFGSHAARKVPEADPQETHSGERLSVSIFQKLLPFFKNERHSFFSGIVFSIFFERFYNSIGVSVKTSYSWFPVFVVVVIYF